MRSVSRERRRTDAIPDENALAWYHQLYDTLAEVPPLVLEPPWAGVTTGRVQVLYDHDVVSSFFRHMFSHHLEWSPHYMRALHAGRGHIPVPDPHYGQRTLVIIWPRYGVRTNTPMVRIPYVRRGGRWERERSESPTSSAPRGESSDSGE